MKRFYFFVLKLNKKYHKILDNFDFYKAIVVPLVLFVLKTNKTMFLVFYINIIKYKKFLMLIILNLIFNSITNHKDIGVLYLLFGSLASILNTILNKKKIKEYLWNLN